MSDPREFCKLLCTKCEKFFSYSNYEKNEEDEYECQICQEPCKPVYQMTFYVKDENSVTMEKVNKLHFYSHFQEIEKNYVFDQIQKEENPKDTSKIQFFFGGMKPTNLYKDQQALQIIEKYLALVQNTNVYIDAIIQKKTLSKNEEKRSIHILYDC